MDDGEGQSASLLERGSAIEKNVFSSFPAAPHGANPTSHRRAGREGRMLQSQWRKGQNSTISQLGRHERGLPASKEGGRRARKQNDLTASQPPRNKNDSTASQRG